MHFHFILEYIDVVNINFSENYLYNRKGRIMPKILLHEVSDKNNPCLIQSDKYEFFQTPLSMTKVINLETGKIDFWVTESVVEINELIEEARQRENKRQEENFEKIANQLERIANILEKFGVK